MCNCNKTTCNECSCKDYCKTTIPASCVKNDKYLDFIKGTNTSILQTLVVSINNALESLSNYPCISYVRYIDPITKIATYKHEIDWECASQYICDTCNNPCECETPTNLTVAFVAEGGSSSLFRVFISWLGSSLAESYRIEYKKSTDFEWSLLSPSHLYTDISSLILDVEDDLDFGYDFRVRANCGDCNSSYISTTIISEECVAPTNVRWNSSTYSLTWNSDPGLSIFSSFEIGYKLSTVSSYTYITVPITEISPGVYSANLISVMFTPNRLYNFSVVKICGTSKSSIGTGCGNSCAVGLQTNPAYTLSSGAAVINWIAIPSIYGYNVSLYNVTDSIIMIPPTNVGLLTSYTTPVLAEGKTYEFTVTPLCAASLPACEGKKVTIIVPVIPQYRYYEVNVYECIRSTCSFIRRDSVRVPYSIPLTIGLFYKDTASSIYIYEILSESTTASTIDILTTSGRSICSEHCPIIPDNHYNSIILECRPQLGCVDTLATAIVYCPYPSTLTVGNIYKDFTGIMYQITGTITSSTGILVDHTTIIDCAEECL